MKGFLQKVLKQLALSVLVLLGVEGIIMGSGLQREVGRWLQMKGMPEMADPDWIVVLGGGGVPSESGLIRCYYGAEAWHRHPEAICIVSLPADEDPEASSVGLMKKELMMRGVPDEKIRMESKALSTRQQAEFISDLFGNSFTGGKVMIVTSPFHIRRAHHSFRQAGCEQLGILSAASKGSEADFGAGTFFRYGVWGLLENQVVILRELVALGWYAIS